MKFSWRNLLKSVKDAVIVGSVGTIVSVGLNALPPEVVGLIGPQVQNALYWLYGALGVSIVANNMTSNAPKK